MKPLLYILVFLLPLQVSWAEAVVFPFGNEASAQLSVGCDHQHHFSTGDSLAEIADADADFDDCYLDSQDTSALSLQAVQLAGFFTYSTLAPDKPECPKWHAPTLLGGALSPHFST
jgi:hypothetical protein